MRRTLKEERITVYRERNRNIRAMGFRSYVDYLNSDLWKSIRAQVLAASQDCRVCGRPAIQVHHVKYRKKDLEGRDLSFLWSVCAGCHRTAEFRRDGEKLTPKQATLKMVQMRRKKR